MNINDAFNKYTKYKITEFGHEVSCVKGLWGVTASTEEQAMNEARNYFRQYFSDGEYDS